MNKGVAFCLDNICVQNQLFPSEADEPPPGDVAGIEGCREWAEFWMVDGVALFHCYLYLCLSSGGFLPLRLNHRGVSALQNHGS